MAKAMSTTFGAGFHAASGKAVDASAYDRWTGRWSRLFIPMVLAAAAVGPNCRVLDVSTGTGEAARMALPGDQRRSTRRAHVSASASGASSGEGWPTPFRIR